MQPVRQQRTRGTSVKDDLDMLAALGGGQWADQGPAPSVFEPDLNAFSRLILFFSGGKDSLASLLDILDRGVPREKIELHHHDVDGNEGSELFDWPCTKAYVQAIGDAFGIKVFYSWRRGGLEGELLRENCGTQPVVFTRGDGSVVTMGGERSKANTRRRFPQVSASLITRWCSSFSKIECGDRLLINDERFTSGKTLIITGERAQENANRARYAIFEAHRADNRNGRTPRWIDHWRNVHHWTEEQVWARIAKSGICPHASYFLSFTRASCLCCVFLGKHGWATVRDIAPARFQRIAEYEKEFGPTVHRTLSVVELADSGTRHAVDREWIAVAMSRTFDRPVFMDPWIRPRGAFGDNCGPS